MNYYLCGFLSSLFLIKANSEEEAKTKLQDFVVNTMFGGMPKRPPRVTAQKCSDFMQLTIESDFKINDLIELQERHKILDEIVRESEKMRLYD